MSKQFATLDCETDPFSPDRIPQPFIWGFYHPDTGFLKFPNTKELFEFLEGTEYRIYAHNGGKFDFHYMLEYIPSWEKVITINGRLAQFKVGNNIFCDSYCILPISLATYQKTKVDYKIFEADEREKPENKFIIEEYLKDDCIFLYEIIDAFLKENGYSLTIASSAIKKLQKIEGFKIEDSGKEFFDQMKPYYYGGRVECFKKGIVKGNIKFFDINSAYPFAMTHEHPHDGCITTHQKKPEIKGHNFYKIQAKGLGVFPFRNENGSLSFPNDNKDRIFCVTGWELLAAIRLGKAKDLIHIEQLEFLITKNFKKYVFHYYDIKLNSAKGSAENIISKLYLNSAYGKFGADASKYRTTYICNQDDFGKAVMEGFSIHSEIHDRLLISKPNDEKEWRYYNAATAASITGFVRAYMAEALATIKSPIYCDTDSIIFKGNHNLNIGDNLGAWKSEGEFHEGGVGGKKIYALRNKKYYEINFPLESDEFNKEAKKYEKTACKGVRLAFDEIIRVCKGEIISKTPISPVYSLKKGKYFLKKTIAMT